MPSFAAKIFIARCARSANLRPVKNLLRTI
ncbi:unnamed protein product [Acanthoscelides obtectus]|uniref:Uncharacterized protein n=1 Tax=Acanthoscelides obtectus TaxID=200917 RepID=A0A9P0NXE7_ACAOB|nr:unnamed protein product [Acanthoscelides obtectus]CAK1621838.1 hypothetical protein AOBTE_LOCUS1161 [Acanthoscelides obtectus]